MKIELGKQIKKYRLEAKYSQEELADKVYVSRQTISNWENDKNYPDIKSLVLISDIFHISLDNLIKGDLERMKKEIDKQEYAKFQKNSTIFTILFIAMLILPIPLVMLFKWMGLLSIYVCMVLECSTLYRLRNTRKSMIFRHTEKLLLSPKAKA